MSLLWLAINESDALLKPGKFDNAVEVALPGLQAARHSGLGARFEAHALAITAAEALLARGRTAEAAALIDPLITGPPAHDDWLAHQARAEIDLLRGDIEDATRRQQQVTALCPAGRIFLFLEVGQRAAELALWAGRPGDALEEVRRVLALFTAADLTILCGRLLAAGMRACADLAEQARARHNDSATQDAVAAAGELASWVDQMAGAPFTDHPLVATIPAGRATWAAERTRLAGPATPRRGTRRRKPGRAWAARTSPGTRGGVTPRRSWTPGSPPRATRRCSPKSANWPGGPASRSQRRRPALPVPPAPPQHPRISG